MTANVKVETRIDTIPELLQLVRELARHAVKFSVEPRFDAADPKSQKGWLVTKESLA